MNRFTRQASITLSGMFVLFFATALVFADTSLSVTVTPPLFQLTIEPGETWSSSLKVVNSNAYDVMYYAESMDFAAEGESGAGSITPVVNEGTSTNKTSYSLASWIELSHDPILVRKGSSASIPFTVHVPQNAEPGGHYAAILVGTKPPRPSEAGASVAISSYVTSLLFVRIQGDVKESGRIREFRTEKSLYQTADANFLLRFENTGNTHLRPTGVISIYNMWGKERGKVFINQTKNFGNVLPLSIRKFEFLWNGEESVFDIGKYSAVATLSFGDDAKQNISATTYFWVVPVVPVAWTIGVILIFLAVLTWGIRRYIRRALQLEVRAKSPASPTSIPNVSPKLEKSEKVTTPATRHYSLQVLAGPIQEGVIDLRRAALGQKTQREASIISPAETTLKSASEQAQPFTLAEFLRAYQTFFVFILVLAGAALLTWFYLEKVLVPTRSYQIEQVSVVEEPQK